MNEARHACKNCPKRFSRTDLLRKHEKIHSAHPLPNAMPQAQDVTAASVSPGRTLTPETSQNGFPAEIAPYQASTMDDFASLNTTSYDNSGICEPRDEYGQGLFDFDLAWTFDFLDENDVAQVEFSETHRDAVIPVLRTNDTDNWLNTISDDCLSQPSWPDKPPQTSIIEENEVHRTLRSSSDVLLKATVISDDLRTLLIEIVTSNSRDLPGTISSPQQAFPANRSLQYFLLLYIKLVHPRFPAMHIPTFSTTKTPAVVLMSMMLAGSCHFACNADRFCYDFLDPCRYWLASAREKNLKSVRT